MFNKKSLMRLTAFIVLLSLITPAVFAQENKKAVVYYNVACLMCAEYVEEIVEKVLAENGVSEVIKKDYVNNKEFRKEFNSESERLGVPLALQAHFAVFIEDKILLEGHVPEHVIIDLLKPENQSRFEKIIVFQDQMEGAESYKVWAFKGEAKEYGINTPVTEYLEWFEANKENLETPKELIGRSLGMESLLPLVLAAGFLDGINPCAFGVLLFFIAFLYTIKRSKTQIWKIGLAYISMIYLAYLLIGLGILQAIAVSGVPHLIGKLGAIFIAVLALVNIKDFFWYGKGFSLKMPSPTKKYISEWMQKGTLPAAIVLGFLVGLCTFPCSGGIYVAILALLSTQTTYLEGLGYMVLYNFMFVLPLVIILVLASSKKVVFKMEEWEKANKKWMKLASGLVMLALAVILWVFSA